MTSRLLEGCHLFWRISLTSSITETYEILFKSSKIISEYLISEVTTIKAQVGMNSENGQLAIM